MTQFVIERQGKLREFLNSLAARLGREEGQDLIEYSLLASLISVVAIAIILVVGPYLQNMFSAIVAGLGST